MEEQAGGHRGGHRIGDGLGQEGGRGGHQGGQQEQAGQEHALAEQGAEQGQPHVAQGGGLVHQGVLDGQGENHGGEHLNIAHRLLRQLRIAGEQAHKHRGQGVGEYHHPRAEGEAQAHNTLDGLFDALQVAGAVVEADHRLGAQGEAAHGHGDEEQVALHDGGAGDQGVPLLRAAVPLEHRVEHDEQDAVGGDDQEGGQAEGEHPPHDGPVRPAPPQGHRHGFAQQHGQHEGAGGHLGDHRGDGRPGHVHVEGEDKDGIQHDVEHRPQHHRGHAQAGVALGDEEAVHAGGHEGEEGAGGVDGQIGVGIAESGLTGAEPAEQLPLGQQEHRRQRHRQHQQHEEAVGQNPARLLLPPLPHAHGHDGGAPQAHQGGKGGQQGDDGAAHPHPRQGQVADALDVADVNAIHDAVEHADQLGQHGGDSQPAHQLKNRVAAQVVGTFHSSLPSAQAEGIIPLFSHSVKGQLF